MITGDHIRSLVKLFEDRQVFLYHACQLTDFQSYLRLGGIPSRALLESGQLEFTIFQTDTTDKENKVWDKVFVNLEDFGGRFARGRSQVPNPYGPILFEISPSALLEVTDVAICLRSAGVRGFNREGEALKKIEDVDRLFTYSVDHPEVFKRRWPKFKETLQAEFEDLSAQTPEISCTVPSGMLSIQSVRRVRVDPYTVNGQSLHNWVYRIKTSYGGPIFRVYERDRFKDSSRKSVYNEIAELIREEIPSLSTILQDHTCSQPLREWAKQILEVNLEWQFKRYAVYLREGTLKPMGAISTPTQR